MLGYMQRLAVAERLHRDSVIEYSLRHLHATGAFFHFSFSRLLVFGRWCAAIRTSIEYVLSVWKEHGRGVHNDEKERNCIVLKRSTTLIMGHNRMTAHATDIHSVSYLYSMGEIEREGQTIPFKLANWRELCVRKQWDFLFEISLFSWRYWSWIDLPR